MMIESETGPRPQTQEDQMKRKQTYHRGDENCSVDVHASRNEGSAHQDPEGIVVSNPKFTEMLKEVRDMRIGLGIVGAGAKMLNQANPQNQPNPQNQLSASISPMLDDLLRKTYALQMAIQRASDADERD
jgi:hypothetical protein